MCFILYEINGLYIKIFKLLSNALLYESRVYYVLSPALNNLKEFFKLCGLISN